MSLTFIPYNRSNVSDDNQLNHSSPYTPIIPPSYSSPYTPIRPPSSIQEPSATAAPLPLLHELNPSVNEPNTLHTQAVRPKNGPGSSALLHRFLSQPDNPKQEKKNVVHPLKPTTFFKSKARLDADPSSIEAFPTWASLEFDTEHHKRARAILTQRTLVWPEGHGCPRCVVKKRTCSVVEGLDLCASCCADRLLSLKCGVCVLPNGSPGIKISRHNTATVKDIPSKTSQQLQMSSESPDPLLSSALDELDSSVWYVNPSNSLDSEPKPLEQGDFSPASIAMEGMAHNDWPLHGLSGDDANISIVSSSDDENDTNASNLGTLQNLPHWAAKVKYKNSSRVFKILKKPTFEYPLGEGCERCIRMRRICVVRDGIVTCASCTASHQSGAQCGVGVPSQARPHKGLLKPMSEHRKPLAPPPNISVRESPLAASPRNKGISKAIPARITPSMLPWISEYTLTDNHIVFKILECPTLQHPVGQGCQPCNELKRACIIREGFTLCASCSARGSRAAKCGFGIPLQSGRWFGFGTKNLKGRTQPFSKEPVSESSSDDESSNVEAVPQLQKLPTWARRTDDRRYAAARRILANPTKVYPIGSEEGCNRCITLKRACAVQEPLKRCASCTADSKDSKSCGITSKQPRLACSRDGKSREERGETTGAYYSHNSRSSSPEMYYPPSQSRSPSLEIYRPDLHETMLAEWKNERALELEPQLDDLQRTELGDSSERLTPTIEPAHAQSDRIASSLQVKGSKLPLKLNKENDKSKTLSAVARAENMLEQFRNVFASLAELEYPDPEVNSLIFPKTQLEPPSYSRQELKSVSMPIGTKDELLKEIVAVEAGSNPKRLICHLAKQNIRQQGRIERQFATITEQNMAIAELRGTIGRLVQAVELLDEKFEERENRKRKSSALDEKLDPDPPKKIRGSSTESNTTTNDVLDLPLNSASIASTSDENQCEDEVASVSLL